MKKSLALLVIALLGLCLPASAASLVNVSPGTIAAATESSDPWGYPAYLAFDRNYGNFTHTGGGAGDNWWRVDLGGPVPINHVILYNRDAGGGCCGDRLRDITIGFYDTSNALLVNSPVLNPGGALGSPATLAFTNATPANARYVQVTRSGSADNILSLAEVEIYADNLARSQPAIQSSGGTYPAANALNGDPGDFTHTDAEATPNWWQVDLGGLSGINSVLMLNRSSCCGGRLRDITVSILDASLATVYSSPLLNPANVLGGGAGDYGSGPPVLAVDLSLLNGGVVTGRYVRVTRTPNGVGGHDGNVLALGEVQVFGDRLSAPSLQPIADTRLISSAADGNFGADANSGVYQARDRTLLKFDLSSIPPGNTILSAILTIYANTQYGSNPNGDHLDLYRLARPWTEMGATWNRYDGATAWTHGGGDAVGTAGAQLSAPYAVSTHIPVNTGPLAWDVTALVSEWHAGTQPNEGMLILDREGTSGLHFLSKENGTANLIPNLSIRHTSAATPPSITLQPQDQFAMAGGSAAFSVGAAGTMPLFYQWVKNGTNVLAGQTNLALTFANLAVADAGNYSVVITNSGGSITSSVAALQVYLWNAARGGIASQSTTDNGGVASRANDGNTDGNWNNGSVTHTGNTPIDNEWWEVDLGVPTYVDRIHVWFRTDCCAQRNENLRLVIYDDPVSRNVLWTQNVGVAPGPNKAFAVLPPTLGRVVRVEHIPGTGNEVLSLAEVQVFEGDHGANLVWVGGNGGNAWDLTNTVNWNSGAGLDIFRPRDNTTFNSSSSETNVSLVGTLGPLSVSVSSSQDYLFQGSGKLTGFALTKSGSGKLTLANTDVNLFGSTLVSEGALQIGDGATAGLLAGAISNNATLVFNRSDSVTGSGVLSGSGLFIKEGAGTLTLTAQPTYTGNTIINAGVLEFYSPGTYTYNGGDLFINNGSTLKFSGSRYDISGKTITFDSAGGGMLDTSSGLNFVAWSGNTFRTVGGAQNSILGVSGMNVNSGVIDLFDITRGTGASDLKVVGPIFNAGGIAKKGNGILELAGANTYTANTIVSNGTLKISGGIYRAAFSTATIYVQNGGVLELDTWAYGGDQSLGQLAAGNQLQIDNGTIRVNGTTSYGRGLTVLGGGATLEAGPGANWNIDITHDSNPWIFTGNPSLRFTGAGNGIFEKDFSSSGALIKDGPGTWALAGTNNYGGGLALNEGSLFINGASTGAVAVAAGTTLGGSGTIDAAVAMPDGSVLVPGSAVGTIGTLTVSSLSLTNTSLDYQLGASTNEGAGINDLIQINGNLTLSGVSTVRVSFASAPVTGEPYTLINYSGAFSGDPTNLMVFNDTRTSYLLDFSETNKVRLVISGGTGNLTWMGLNLNNNWDTTNTANWDNGVTGADIFYPSDSVSFINDPNSWTLDLVGTLRPAQVSMMSDQDYLWQGSGRINGAQLNLTGSGTLTFANSATNHFALGTLISSGTLQIGNGGATGVLPTGPLTNNATLAFNRSDDLTISEVLVGTGFVRKNGANTLTLSAANAHMGGTIVSAGTLKVANNAALGNVGAITTVSNGATLDIAGQMLWDHTNPIVINGPGVAPTVGALTKSEPTQIGANQIRNLTLDSDASIGGVTNARFDIGRGDWPGPVPVAPIHLDGQGHTLSLVGNIYLGILAGAQNLPSVIVGSGTSIAPHNDNSLGNATLTLNGGTLTPWGPDHYFPNPLVLNSGFIDNQAYTHTYTGPVQVNGPVQINTISGGNITFAGNITGAGSVNKIGGYSLFLGGDNSGFAGAFTNNESNTFFTNAASGSASATWVLNSGNLASYQAGTPTVHLGALFGSGGLLGNNIAGAAVTFSIGALGGVQTFSGNIVDTIGGGGTTAITKVGADTQILGGACSHTGGTLVQSGTLQFDGTLTAAGGTVAVVGGTLAGGGAIGVPVVVLPGGTLAPGASLGSLTISSTLSLAGNVLMDIDKTAGVRTSDHVLGVSTLTYGGTLTIVASGEALVDGDSFPLFSALSYAGDFTAFVLPPLAPGLAWDTSTLGVDGTIRVGQGGSVTGQVALEHFTGLGRDGNGTRAVTFTATITGGATAGLWTLPLNFTNGVATYTLPSVVLSAANLSAKTPWTLRTRVPASFSSGVDFTGAFVLRAGDLDGSNTVDAGDYYLLATAWYTSNPAADLDGDGVVDLNDYFLLASHWGDGGDPK